MAPSKSEAARKLGSALRAARGQLSQQNVADAAVIHVSNYGEYERGEREIGLHMLVRLAHVLGTTASELLADVHDVDVPGVAAMATAVEERVRRQAVAESLRSAQKATR